MTAWFVAGGMVLALVFALLWGAERRRRAAAEQESARLKVEPDLLERQARTERIRQELREKVKEARRRIEEDIEKLDAEHEAKLREILERASDIELIRDDDLDALLELANEGVE